MKKAIIFILGVSCISGSAPQPKKLILRQYNVEVTRKLREKINTLEPANDSATYLKDIDRLIKEGADPNMTLKDRYDHEIDLIFMIAMIPYMVDNIDVTVAEAVLKSALENGANASAADSEGKKILFYAAENGSPGMVKLLLDHGASANPQNNNGANIIDILKDQIKNKKNRIETLKTREIPQGDDLEQKKKALSRLQHDVDRLQKNLQILQNYKRPSS